MLTSVVERQTVSLQVSTSVTELLFYSEIKVCSVEENRKCLILAMSQLGLSDMIALISRIIAHYCNC